MKQVYVDLTTERKCVGIIVHEAQVIFAGTQVHAEPEKYENSEPALRFRKMGLHFWFGTAPEPDLYTIPMTTVFAHDGAGGYFLSTEEDALYYWDSKQVFRIGDSLQVLPEHWRKSMTPTQNIQVYPSRDAAEQVQHIYSLRELMEEFA